MCSQYKWSSIFLVWILSVTIPSAGCLDNFLTQQNTGSLALPYKGVVSTDANVAAFFVVNEGDGTGIGGITYSDTAHPYGVRGIAFSTEDVENYGGIFSAHGKKGVGVAGVAENYEGRESYGGFFVSKSTHGIGVYGLALNSNPGSSNHGGYFESRSPSGTGVYGSSPDTSDALNFGGFFMA
ncbi:hypothetical protein AMJ83_07150, partial [candidate division WOR_3 bacterium SM23_42]